MSHSKETSLTGSIVVLILAGVVFSLPVLLQADVVEQPGSSQFDRVDVETIKIQTNQILSEPSFSPRKTFWQWFSEKFSRWKGPRFDFGPGWSTFILSIIIIWCVLTLIAILIHLIWTLHLLIWPNRNSFVSMEGAGSESVKVTSFEELFKIARELAKKEAFREAISILIVALLRWLDFRGIVRFHESKTNGDYAREYPSDYAGQSEFKAFVVMFEQVIYGGLQGNCETYQKMNSLMEHIHNSAWPKA